MSLIQLHAQLNYILIIHTNSYPRAALIGNPSDGYFGKTIAFVFKNFSAQILLYETPELEILPQERDRSIFSGIQALYQDVQQFGYYGGIRLLKATIKKFFEYSSSKRIELGSRNFTIRYQTDIPQRLGLAGSSAIITACMRALMQFYRIEIPPPILANLVLSVETEELGIGAGLQDRVAQAFESPVYMDFDKNIMDRQGFGIYQTFSKEMLPPVYLAYRTDLSEGSEVLHNDLRGRYNKGDEKVHKAMRRFAEITTEFMKDLQNGQQQVGSLMDENFDLRASICAISSPNLKMIKAARSVGASAKFTGSGGAIIGTYQNEEMFEKLHKKLEGLGIQVLKPEIMVNERYML